jgi:hypothetical protein
MKTYQDYLDKYGEGTVLLEEAPIWWGSTVEIQVTLAFDKVHISYFDCGADSQLPLNTGVDKVLEVVPAADINPDMLSISFTKTYEEILALQYSLSYSKILYVPSTKGDCTCQTLLAGHWAGCPWQAKG